MALIYADIPSEDTGRYGTSKAFMTDGLWAQVTSAAELLDDPDPNITGNVLYLGSAFARFVYPAAVSTAGIATRVWIPNIPVGESTKPAIHQYRGGSNELLVTIYITPTGGISAYRWDGASATLLGQTTGPVVTANAWRHIESKVYFDNSAGTVEVRVEGVVVLDLNTLDTNPTQCAQVAIGVSVDNASVNQLAYFKDVVFWDGTGSENTDFVGPCGVYRLTPNADVSSGWTPSTGSDDYALVDEAPPVDSDYIYAGDPPPAASIMSMTNLPADIISVRGLVSVVRSEKSDGGDGSLQVSMSPNGTDWDDGSDDAITTAFAYTYDVSEVSPATTDPWTPVEVNAMEVKLNRTA